MHYVLIWGNERKKRRSWYQSWKEDRNSLKCPGVETNIFLKETLIRAISMLLWHSSFGIFGELRFRTNSTL